MKPSPHFPVMISDSNVIMVMVPRKGPTGTEGGEVHRPSPPKGCQGIRRDVSPGTEIPQGQGLSIGFVGGGELDSPRWPWVGILTGHSRTPHPLTNPHVISRLICCRQIYVSLCITYWSHLISSDSTLTFQGKQLSNLMMPFDSPCMTSY